VRYAFAAFVERFGMQYGVLLTPDHLEHVAQRDRLEDVVGFLLEVEECGKGSSLLSKPIHDGLVRSIEEAEALLERFRQAVSVERSIEAGEIEFPKYREFRTRVRERLKQWHEVPPQELGEIFVINRGYATLQEGFNSVIERIHERIAWWLANIDRAGEHRDLIMRMIDQKEILEVEIREGKREPDEGVSELEDLLQDMTHVADALGFEDTSAGDAGTLGRTTLADCCKILGVPETATSDELKKAYRRLAMISHPDRNPGDRKAEERFKEINAAYHALRDLLAVGV
jgi:DnaJ-domain-containing protein 1